MRTGIDVVVCTYDNAAQLLMAANPGSPDDQLSWEMYAQIGAVVHRVLQRLDLPPRPELVYARALDYGRGWK